jgi:hypothetical protein
MEERQKKRRLLLRVVRYLNLPISLEGTTAAYKGGWPFRYLGTEGIPCRQQWLARKRPLGEGFHLLIEQARICGPSVASFSGLMAGAIAHTTIFTVRTVFPVRYAAIRRQTL